MLNILGIIAAVIFAIITITILGGIFVGGIYMTVMVICCIVSMLKDKYGNKR